jgi:hypothetical protein
MKKRPKNPRAGDIFVDSAGELRILESRGYYKVNCFGDQLFLNYSGYSYSKDYFRENVCGCTEYYLGNIEDIKPKG